MEGLPKHAHQTVSDTFCVQATGNGSGSRQADTLQQLSLRRSHDLSGRMLAAWTFGQSFSYAPTALLSQSLNEGFLMACIRFPNPDPARPCGQAGLVPGLGGVWEPARQRLALVSMRRQSQRQLRPFRPERGSLASRKRPTCTMRGLCSFRPLCWNCYSPPLMLAALPPRHSMFAEDEVFVTTSLGTKYLRHYQICADRTIPKRVFQATWQVSRCICGTCINALTSSSGTAKASMAGLKTSRRTQPGSRLP